MEQHLAIGGASRTLDLVQETSTFGVVGGEDLRGTGGDGLGKRALVQDCGSGSGWPRVSQGRVLQICSSFQVIQFL